MSYNPLMYDGINLIEGSLVPSDIMEHNNALYNYWLRFLFQRLRYVVEITETDVISGRNKPYFYASLFRYGFVAVINTDKYGIIFQPATVGGYNIYYQPTYILVANPLLPKLSGKPLDIGKDCEILMLTSDYHGVWDVLSYFASRLASIDVALLVSIQNSKTPYMGFAKDKASAQTLKKMMDKMMSGQCMVTVDDMIMKNWDDDMPVQFLERAGNKDRYITHDLMMDRRDLLRQFDLTIGIPTQSYEKKERNISSEIQSSYIGSQAMIDVWMENFEDTAKIVNEKYGTNFQMEKRIPNVEELGEEEHVLGETDNTGSGTVDAARQ